MFSSPPTFDDPFQSVEAPVRNLLVNALREKVKRLESIVHRELGKETGSNSRRNIPGGQDGTSKSSLTRCALVIQQSHLSCLSIVRNTLYEGLRDHELARPSSDVCGMARNLFFLTHSHKENGGTDDTASNYNMYEASIQSVS